MRNKFLLLVIAGVSGTIAAVGASKWMQAQGTSEKQQTAEIFVTVQDIEIGEQFTAENIKLEAWPIDRLPEGSITKLEEIEGMYSNQRLYSGEPLIKRKVSASAGNTRRDIPRDFSVVSMQTDPASSVATLVQPGDRVNVMGFFKKSEVIPQTMTQQILSGIRVYAVDGRKTRTEGEDVGKAARTISLLIHKKDEEAWTYANELGNVRLSLSHPDEYENKDASDGADEAGQQFLRWIAESGVREAAAPQAPPTVLTNTQVPTKEEPVRMTKMSGNAMEVYELRDGIWVVVQSSGQPGGASTEATTTPAASAATSSSDQYSYLNGSESPFFEEDVAGPKGSSQPVGLQQETE